jgi:hypothetical protein
VERLGVAEVSTRAAMWPFGREVDATPLEVIADDEDRGLQVAVPGFGVLIVGKPGGGAWQSLLVQPDAAGGFSPASRTIRRDVVVADDGTLLVELLPCSAGEPRLQVRLEPGL